MHFSRQLRILTAFMGYLLPLARGQRVNFMCVGVVLSFLLAACGRGQTQIEPPGTERSSQHTENGGADGANTLDAMYCGPDSLWFALMRLGINRSLPEVRRSFDTELKVDKRCSLLDLKKKAQASGVHAYTLRWDRYGMADLSDYCETHHDVQVILHLPTRWGHFAPVVRFKQKRCQILDIGSFRSSITHVSEMPPTEKMDGILLSTRPIPKSVLSTISSARTVAIYRYIALCAIVGVASFGVGFYGRHKMIRKPS
jgi:hypothetical protein